MYNTVKRIINAAFILFLLLLFTVPRLYLTRCASEMTALCEQAMRADEPGEALAALELAYEKNSPVLRLFLHHASVDAVGAGVAAAVPLREREALDAALSVVIRALDSLRSIEDGRLAGLL